MIVTIRYPKPLDDFRPPLNKTNPILWIFHFTNYPDLIQSLDSAIQKGTKKVDGPSRNPSTKYYSKSNREAVILIKIRFLTQS